jgi:serine/threonine protein kinase
MGDSTVILPRDDSPPPEIPDLRLVRRVGRGAFGEVWLAENRTTGKVLAVKVVRLQSPDAADRAAREIASLTRLDAGVRIQHENLLTIHHVGRTHEYLYYTMDAADDVQGASASLDAGYRPATLASRVETGALRPAECLRCAEQLLKGLAFLHEADLVHRDVKPSNCVFVHGTLKLADFGLLTEADGTLSLAGTPKYMPPEGRMDSRADVYAAGLTIYEMYTGLPADCFPRWSPAAVADRGDPIMKGLNLLVLRACDRDPSRRFQNAAEMLDALRRQQGQAEGEKRRHRTRIILAAALLIALLATAVGLGRLLRPQHVDVNFITEPFEADIYLDGRQAVDRDGVPYLTPCTIPGLRVGPHHVTFKKAGLADLDAGVVNFGAAREVAAKWESGR